MSVFTTQGTSSLASFDQSSVIARKDLFQTCPREILQLILSLTPQPSQAQAVSSIFRDVMNEVSRNFLFVTFDSPFRSQNPRFFNETDPTLSDEQRAEYKERNDRIAESFRKHALAFGPYCSRSPTALATFFLQQEIAHHRALDSVAFPTRTLSLNPESYLSLVKTNELAFFFANLQSLYSPVDFLNLLLYMLFFIHPIIDSMSHVLHLAHHEILEAEPLANPQIAGALEAVDRFQNTLFRLAIQGNPQFATLLEAEYTHSLQTVIEKFLTVLIPFPSLFQAIPPEAYPDISAFLHFMSNPQPANLKSLIRRSSDPQIQTLCPFLSNPRNRKNLLNSFLSLITQNVMSMLEHDPSPEVHSLLEELKKSFSQEEQRNYRLLMARPAIPQKRINQDALRFISDLTRQIQRKTIPGSGLQNIFSILRSSLASLPSTSFDSDDITTQVTSLKDFFIHALKLTHYNESFIEHRNVHSLLVSNYTLEVFPGICHYTHHIRPYTNTFFPFPRIGKPSRSLVVPRIPMLIPPKMPYFWNLQTLSLAGQRIVPSTFDQLPSGVIINDIFSLNRSTLDRTSTHPALAQLYDRTSRINLLREGYLIPVIQHLAPGRHPHLCELAQICAGVYAETHLDFVAQHPFLYSATIAGLELMQTASPTESIITLVNQSVFSYALSRTSTHPQWSYPIAIGLQTVSSTISDGLIRGFTLRKTLGISLFGITVIGMRPALSLSSKGIHLVAKGIFHFFGK